MIKEKVRTCRVCGCTDNNCSKCIEETGVPCYWIKEDLCSRCRPKKNEAAVIRKTGKGLHTLIEGTIH